MNVMNDILEKIQAYDTIIIHRHQNPDPDAIGSQVGLRDLLRAHFPQKRVLATGYDEPTLTWLAEMDDVKDEDYEGALVIVCDTANTPRIDDKRYTTGDFLIKIDHHPNDDAYGDLLWVDTESSSTSELITLFAKELDLELPVSAARLLYAGIVGDTGRFLYPATSTRTFEIAATLRSIPFDFTSLARQMDTINLKTAKLQGYVYDHLEIDEHGAARVTLTQELLKKFDLRDSETAAIVGAPGRIDTVSVWAIFVEQADGHFRVRMRSKRKVINEIAKRHNGGGHPLASGANSYSLEENDQIYKELQEVASHERRLRTISQPFILVMGFSFAVAILSSFLPWANLNAGNFGSYTWNGLRGDGWFVIIFAVVAIVLACLNDVKTSLPKGFAIGVIVSGSLSTVVTLIDVFGVNKYAVNFNGYGVSIGFGLILALIASIAIVVTGLLAMSGGKITKGTFEELSESGKGFAQSVGRVTTSTVKLL